MIFEKRGMWKISGYPEKYATYAEAAKALESLGIQQQKVEIAKAVSAEEEKKKVEAAEAERLKRLAQLSEDSTPYEKMIAKNICTICDMEPCECFTSIKKTELGRFEETNTFSL